MDKPTVTIIGLGLTGASVGLALQRETTSFEIVGHDKSPDAAQVAKRTGAVQRVEWNLHRAVEPADLVVMAVPLSELDELYSLIAEDLREGCLVLTLAGLLQPAIGLAEKYLPSHAHFVAGHPILSGVGGEPTPRADLFDEVVFALAAGAKTEPGGVQLASDFVERVGATPLFVDALEHDGIMAGVEQLPQVMAAALMQISAAGDGLARGAPVGRTLFCDRDKLWRESSRTGLCGAGEPGELAATHPADAGCVGRMGRVDRSCARCGRAGAE